MKIYWYRFLHRYIFGHKWTLNYVNDFSLTFDYHFDCPCGDTLAFTHRPKTTIEYSMAKIDSYYHKEKS